MVLVGYFIVTEKTDSLYILIGAITALRLPMPAAGGTGLVIANVLSGAVALVAALLMLSIASPLFDVVVYAAMTLAVTGFDLLVFRNIDKVMKRMTRTKLMVSEIVFGILLTAVAVNPIAYGLVQYGVIESLGVH